MDAGGQEENELYFFQLLETLSKALLATDLH
jgi:hypothetical protein